MKKQRTTPFGYTMKNGKMMVDQSEAAYVRKIFKMCEDGLSIATIAERMQKSGVPYSAPNPQWDKHKVRRILEKPAYTGENGFPVILKDGAYAAARQTYTRRTKAWQSPTENKEKRLWSMTYCAECGSRMPRSGGYRKSTGILVMTCSDPQCGNAVTYQRDDFMQEIAKQVGALAQKPQASDKYEPSQTVLRLTSEINRQIEKPSDEKTAQTLILQAAAERYACCSYETAADAEPCDGIDWQALKQYAGRIEIHRDGQITITGK